MKGREMVKRGRGRPKKIASGNSIDVGDGGPAMVESAGEVPCSNDLPEFFKIYVPALCSDSLRVPPEFIKKFGENIPTTVTLRKPSGPSWQVHMNGIDDLWFFQQGWPEFVEENSVEDGDFLTFCYAGNSVFFVKVFAINGCRKRDDDADEINGKPIKDLQVNGASEPETSKHSRATRRNFMQKRSVARKSASRNPSFSVTVTKYYICKGCLHIPAGFWKVYLRKDEIGSRMVTLRIKNESWPVGLSFAVGRVRFARGWSKFAKDNCLRHGTLCTFQLIDRIALDFKVTIFR